MKASYQEKKVCMVVLNSFKNDARVLREAKTLKEAGYRVFVLAIYEGGLKRKEMIENVQVVRFFLRTKNLPKKKIFQILKFIEFSIKSLTFILKNKPKFCHCHDLNALPVGYASKKILKNYLIYDSHELESERSTIKRQPKWFQKILRKTEHFLIRRVDAVIVVCDSIADYIAKQDNIKRPTVIRNIPEFKNIFKDRGEKKHFGFSKDYKIIIYQGGLFFNRGLEELIESMKIINNERIILAIVGEGLLKNKLKEYIKRFNLEKRVIFKGHIPPGELLEITSQADLGIVPVKKITLSYYFALPNKFFEYISSGLPVLTSDFPEMKKIVENYKIGETFNPENPEEIAKKIKKIFYDENYYRQLKENVKEAREHLTWSKEKEKLLKLYSKFI